METKIEEAAYPAMDKRSKILLAVFAVAIFLSIGISFYKFMVVRDYIIEAQVDCDPAVEVCFVWECDPESEEEGMMCTGNPEEDASYYKVIRKNAMNIPVCDPRSEECEPIACMNDEPECEYVLCKEGNEDGIACSNPEDFVGDSEETDIPTDENALSEEAVGAKEIIEGASLEMMNDVGAVSPGSDSE
ncbi:MAG: hypothetical protein KBD19_02440 [Candidatus Moranbacteria bacterium]|nr:hypothetical protein [Candidatus Moranbacteria bacterium]